MRTALLSSLVAAFVFISTLRADALTADETWQAYQAALSSPPSKPYEQLTPLERCQWIEARMIRARELALTFIERFPADPRRWNIILGLSPTAPRFVKEWGALDAKGAPMHPVVDEAAASDWTARVTALRAGLAHVTDLPAEVRLRLAAEDAMAAVTSAAVAHRRGEPVDLTVIRTKVQEFAARFPNGAGGQVLLDRYSMLVQAVQPESLEREWRLFSSSPNTAMADLARQKLEFIAVARQPLQLAFTAADGRAVDLAKLRGKVVLLDFWATWCGPCIAELPNVKRVHAAYRDRGFAVVGIALENAKLLPSDTPAQTAAKLEPARQALLAFIAKNEMPWPQYFDGKWWKNDVAARYAINAIPAMFLLDRDGRIVSTNARGEKLESEVRRLLGL